jgi:hypothetical protein
VLVVLIWYHYFVERGIENEKIELQYLLQTSTLAIAIYFNICTQYVRERCNNQQELQHIVLGQKVVKKFKILFQYYKGQMRSRGHMTFFTCLTTEHR